MINRLRIIVSVFFILTIVALPLFADENEPMPVFIIIADLRDKDPNIYTLDSDDINKLSDDLKKLSGDTNKLSNDDINTFILNYKSKKIKTTDRIFDKKGKVIRVYTFTNNDKSVKEIQFSEIKRQSKLLSDIKVVLNAVKRTQVPIKITRKDYILIYQKATLNINVTYFNNVDENTADTKPIDSSISRSFTTGTAEHLFLSADLSLKSVKELKYNSTTKELESKDKPNNFYIGLNFIFADILSEPNLTDWDTLRPYGELLSNFTIKGLFNFSKKPLDSLGVAVGYRFPDIKYFGELKAFSPFIGFLWTKGDNNKYKRECVWGISLNIDVVSDWTKN